MQFYMMNLLDALGKIAWVRSDFLSQGKISSGVQEKIVQCILESILQWLNYTVCDSMGKIRFSIPA